MHGDLKEVLKQIEALSFEQQLELLRILEKKMIVLLQDPRAFFDDWDDEEVDKLYKK